MTPVRLLHIAGHDLASIAFNADQPGIPVLLLHGVSSSVYFWDSNLTATFRNFGPCYALSLPGHYPAKFPPAFTASDLTAESIAHVLTLAIRELVGEQPVLLAGCSTGGFAALSIAAHAPEIVHGVISIAGFACGQWTGGLGLAQRWCRSGKMGRMGFKLIYNTAKVHHRVLYQYFRAYSANPKWLFAYPDFAEILRTAIFPPYRRLDLDAMVIYFSRMPDIDITPLLPRITAPVLAITGDADPIVPSAQARLIAERVPRAELAVLEGGVGHLPFYEVPDAYRQAVTSWLQALSSKQE